MRCAQQLGVPRAYATNGIEIIERDLVSGREQVVESVPPPQELWATYAEANGLAGSAADLLAAPFNRNKRTAAGEVLTPRWYQTVAVLRVLAAIARGERRALLLMATGTGKTFTAMQIVHKLRVLAEQTEGARAVLSGLLDRYAEYGVDDMASAEVLALPPLAEIGTPLEIARLFGGAAAYHSSVEELQRWIYTNSA